MPLLSHLIQNSIPEPSHFSPKTYKSCLASLSSLLPRISQSSFPMSIFPISSPLLPTLSSIHQILQNSDSKTIQIFACPAPWLLGAHTLCLSGVLQCCPLAPSSFPHSGCSKYLAPQASYTTPCSPILLSTLHSQFFSQPIALLPT